MPVRAGFITPHPPLAVPDVGSGREREISKTIGAFKKTAVIIKDIAPETIVFITPHSRMYADYIHISPGETAIGSFARFGVNNAKYAMRYDTDFVGKLAELAEKNGLRAGTDGERDSTLDHGVLVPAHFINEQYTDYKCVRVSVSGLGYGDHYRLGELIAEAARGKDAVIVASGDLSHKLAADGPYGFAPEGPEFDKTVVEIIKSGELDRFKNIDEDFAERAAECGLRPFITLAGALRGARFSHELFSYEGPFGVGYCVAAFIIDNSDELRGSSATGTDPYVKLAKYILETRVKTNKTPRVPDDIPDEMKNGRSGVFVSLKKDGELRGCIGTIAPTQANIAEEIAMNAVSAGLKDPRFYPVGTDELPYLSYSVDVLMPAEPIASFDELDVKKYGVIVTNGYRRGLLLPNLEGVDTVADQVDIALRKAGIRPDENYKMERFQVVRHK